MASNTSEVHITVFFADNVETRLMRAVNDVLNIAMKNGVPDKELSDAILLLIRSVILIEANVGNGD
jgi:hypothetical protein